MNFLREEKNHHNFSLISFHFLSDIEKITFIDIYEIYYLRFTIKKLRSINSHSKWKIFLLSLNRLLLNRLCIIYASEV